MDETMYDYSYLSVEEKANRSYFLVFFHLDTFKVLFDLDVVEIICKQLDLIHQYKLINF